MAQFQDSYFEDEIRNDFKIEGTMKRAWAAQIEVLEEIDKICCRHGLTYYADWGTLLGAVRHKGFIPWDDDIDIAMPREDYMRFIQAAQAELPAECTVLSMFTEEDYTEAFARVVNSKEISFKKEHLKKYHGCPFIVGIDIFPLDRLPVGLQEKKIQIKMLRFLYETMKSNESKKDMEERLNTIECLCGVKLDRERNIQNQLLKLMDTVCQLYNTGTGEVTEFVNYIQNDKYIFQPEWFEKRIWLPFETIQIPVPEEYDKVLRAMYGEYEIPRMYTAEHNYPFYRQQEEILKQYINNLQ